MLHDVFAKMYVKNNYSETAEIMQAAKFRAKKETLVSLCSFLLTYAVVRVERRKQVLTGSHSELVERWATI